MVASEVTPSSSTAPHRRLKSMKAPAIEAYQARGASPEDYSVPGARGLELRVHPTGAKTFRWRIRSAAGERRITVGPFSFKKQPGHVTLGEAVDWAGRLLAAHKGGAVELERVVAELEAVRAPKLLLPPQVGDGPTVAEVAERWLRSLEGRRKRPQEAKAIVDRHILSAAVGIAHRPLRTLKKSDCVAIIERVVDGPGGERKGAPVHAGKVLALLKQLLDYAENTVDDFTNPAARLKATNLRIENNKRDRWLSAEELPVFWKVLEAKEAPPSVKPAPGRPAEREVDFPEKQTRLALQVLLLTAVRTQELRLARWEHIDLKAALWTVPVSSQKLTLKQAKQAKPFVIPLSPGALDLFHQLRAIAEKVPPKYPSAAAWVLGSIRSADGCYTDKALGRAMNRLWSTHPLLKVLPEATPHDLRRTARTWLGKLGVPPHVAERCLNHSLGTLVAIYDQGDYLDERRAALERWDAHLRQLVAGKVNVVPFPARGARS